LAGCSAAAVVGDRRRERLGIGVGARFLVWRPRTLHRLAGDLEVIDELGPSPHSRALAGLR
ncbi:MAG: hypothetical protein ACPHIW_08035, partial [Ilumatobacteraceae bacterium]